MLPKQSPTLRAPEPPKPHPSSQSKTPQNRSPAPNDPAKPQNIATSTLRLRDSSTKAAASTYTTIQTRWPAAPRSPASAQSQSPIPHTPPETRSDAHAATQTRAESAPETDTPHPPK